MRLIGLAVVLAGSILLAPLAGEAQPATKIARIGYLAIDLTTSARYREAFLQGLRDLGYIERQNVLIEYRDAERKPERLPALAAELAALKIDIIVTGGGTAAAPIRREGLAGNLLTTGNGALAHKRDGWERTPWHAVQVAAWDALRR